MSHLLAIASLVMSAITLVLTVGMLFSVNIRYKKDLEGG